MDARGYKCIDQKEQDGFGVALLVHPRRKYAKYITGRYRVDDGDRKYYSLGFFDNEESANESYRAKCENVRVP